MNLSASDAEFLAARYTAARNRYQPAQVRTLLIAEAPPCDTDRYFYFEEVPRQDSLFLEITGILYPEQKKKYLARKRPPDLKAALLENLQEDGYLLTNLLEVPHNLGRKALAEALPAFLNRTKKLAGPETAMILIGADVYDICHAALLAEGYAVSSERIPFPGSGQQGVFREKFRRALGMENR